MHSRGGIVRDDPVLSCSRKQGHSPAKARAKLIFVVLARLATEGLARTVTAFDADIIGYQLLESGSSRRAPACTMRNLEVLSVWDR